MLLWYSQDLILLGRIKLCNEKLWKMRFFKVNFLGFLSYIEFFLYYIYYV